MDAFSYEAPEVIDLGDFTEATGNTGIRNNDEIYMPFDEWH
ncbi:lasso RiPP family leader peptide-containing protein [Actinomadura fibrosa]|uniref:Lasso RiPP family leader peptide-containing protein n=1 Tax=Actinomadura fibrosa TaxID=111802 RepID=A0ABW2XTM5_9ACTN|nr:lasso RiPP family leader peptide-containing protein [Actinomadura fibrosa]